MTDNFEEKKMRTQFPLAYAELEVQTGVNRRQFLGLIGASMALAGVTTTGCVRRPKEYVYPEVGMPENILPGVAKKYSTSAYIAGSVFGLSVTSTDGRPTKIDGNSRHSTSNPIKDSNIGSSNAFAQAEILNLYDPERGQKSTFLGNEISRSEALKKAKSFLSASKAKDGQGLAFLYQTNPSLTFCHQLNQFQKIYPKALFVNQDTSYSASRTNVAKLLSGETSDFVYSFEKAKVILAIDSDFLGLEADNVRNARQFAENRRVLTQNATMNRLYSVESSISITGGMADHRWTLSSVLMGEFLIELCRELKNNSIFIPPSINISAVVTSLDEGMKKWIKALAKDLASQKGNAVLVVGDKQPEWIHALSYAINNALGAVASGFVTLLPVCVRPSFEKTMADFASAQDQNLIDTLIVIGGNPVYAQPADFNLDTRFLKIKNSVYLSFFPDETAQKISLYIPQTHFLESWGDTISTDWTVSIRQPLIAPLFENCVNEHEFVSYLLDDTPESDYNLVRSSLKQSSIGKNLDNNWRKYLSEGVISDFPKPSVLKLKSDYRFLNDDLDKYKAKAPSVDKMNVEFVLDRSVYDGRYANNAWLQEIPDSMYKLVWDNAFLISPKTAKALGVNARPKPGRSHVDVLKVTYQNRIIEAAVWEVPGIADNTLVLPLGYGRNFGTVSKGSGFNANLIRTSKTWVAEAVQIEKTGTKYSLVAAQEQDIMSGTPGIKEDRPPVVRQATLEEYKKNSKFVLEKELLEVDKQKSNLFSYPANPSQSKWARQQWGMTIDLNTCIGCNACTVACQAENNISVVGKKEVFRNREMSWIRIDRYFNGNVDAPDVQTVFQPMNCMHCENAPCEAVCPVAATTHSPDGLNDMTYNRCVGTRYCANNCPYKVRRYNFFNYSKIDDERNPLYAMQKNPNVTVRFRGVMEKCTYCVQRINTAKVKANSVSPTGLIADGEIVTACQSVCPTNSIVFGDVADPKTLVSQRKALPTNYSLLGELNTKPRTTYLAKLRNVNPEIG